MSYLVTVSKIARGARFRCDDEQDEALADDTTVLIMVQDALTRLHSFYVKADPDMFRTEVDYTADGSASYDLPEDWFSTVGVDYVQSSTTKVQLDRVQEADHTYYDAMTGSYAVGYRCIGDQLYLYPKPSSGTYRLIYLTDPQLITDSTDEIDCRMGHDVYLEMLVARWLLEKEESYDGRFERQIKEIEENLTEEANMRYLRDPVTMSPRKKLRRGYGRGFGGWY